MGIWDKFRKVVKKTAQTVIPGGSKGYLEPSKPKPTHEAGRISLPSEGQRSPSENIQQAAREDTTRERKKSRTERVIDVAKEVGRTAMGEDVTIGGKTIKTGIGSTAPYKDPETGEVREVPVLAGTVDLGPGGAIKVASKIIQTGASKSQIALKSKETGIPVKVLDHYVKQAAIKKATQELMIVNTKKAFVGPMLKKITKYAGKYIAYTGVGGMAVWLASDNMIGMSSMAIRDAQERFQNNQLTKEQTLERIDMQTKKMEYARGVINYASIVAPIMWPFRKVFMVNADDNLEEAAYNRDFVDTLPETTGAMYERLREEDIARDEAFVEARELRDELSDEKYAKIARQKEKDDSEDEARFRETTLLFEAIRKRGLGIELTPEEMALLIKYGLDIKLVAPSYEYEAPSQLSFGLF